MDPPHPPEKASTSAQDRFDRIFRNIPKPAEPKVDRRNVIPVVDDKPQDIHDKPLDKTMKPNDDKHDAGQQNAHAGSVTATGQNTNATNARGVTTEPAPSVVNAAQLRYFSYGKISAKHTFDDDEAMKEYHTEPAPGPSASIIGRYCSFNLLTKFPYKYMDDDADLVSRKFFAANKIYERGLSLYYAYPPASLSSTAILLTPYDEVKVLVDEISSAFDIKVDVPSYPFQMTFYNDGIPPPKFLGKVRARNDPATFSEKIPAQLPDYCEVLPDAAPETVEAFENYSEKCEKLIEANKKKPGLVKRKKKSAQKAAVLVIEGINQLRRSQRYFGLRPRVQPTQEVSIDGPVEQRVTIEAQELKRCGVLLDALDTTKPVPYDFESHPVIISVDVESWEENHNMITEIGVSTLDTRDLIDLAPGNEGENWIKKIRSRHFRIKGREHLVNHKYVQGSPHSFRFGKSEFVAADEAPNAIDGCFEEPFSSKFECAGAVEMDKWAAGKPESTLTGEWKSDAELDAVRAALDNTHIHEPALVHNRNIIVLGHDISSDLNYLTTLGSRIFSAPSAADNYNPSAIHFATHRNKILSSILEALDTAALYKSLTKSANTKSLASVCTDLNITPWFAHNAGNDARYTLEALIKLVIKARQADDEASKEGVKYPRTLLKNARQEFEMQNATDKKVAAFRERVEQHQAVQSRQPTSLFAQEGKKVEDGMITIDQAIKNYNERYGVTDNGESWVDGSRDAIRDDGVGVEVAYEGNDDDDDDELPY